MTQSTIASFMSSTASTVLKTPESTSDNYNQSKVESSGRLLKIKALEYLLIGLEKTLEFFC